MAANGQELHPIATYRSRNMTKSELAAWCLQQTVRTAAGCLEWQKSRHPRGYGYVGIDDQKTCKVAHLILEQYVAPRPKGAYCLHSCHNPPCINPEHLRWGDQRANMDDMMRGKRYGPSVKLSQAKADEIRARLANGERGCDLAVEYGVKRPAISRIKHGQRWNHA